MSRWEKTLDQIKSGKADANVSFSDFLAVITRTGWQFKRQSGSHMIFTHPQKAVILNIQKSKDGKAKAYQIKQFRDTL